MTLMTNEEAKKILKAKLECLKRETIGIDCNDGYNCDECELLYAQGTVGEHKEALDLAIKALEQQPNRCDSCTHSEEQDGSNCYECVKGMADNFEAQPKTSYIFIDANKLAKEVTEKALDEVTYKGKTIREWAKILVKQQSCEDCISREAVIRLVEQYPNIIGNRCNGLIADIKHLPSVTPQPKIGKWQHYEGMLICSKCGAEFYDDIMEYCGDGVPKCCPSCGAKMEVEE